MGSAEKRRYLTETMEIPHTDIFDSRTPTFFPDVMGATGGRGVDLCLNSLSGELLHYSWQCVAEFGTLLEIGKRDLVGRGKLSLLPFEDNRNYAGIDLSHIFVEKPQLWKSYVPPSRFRRNMPHYFVYWIYADSASLQSARKDRRLFP